MLCTNIPGIGTNPAPPPYSIHEISTGGHRRRVAFVGLVTLDPSLYDTGPCPAFGGVLGSAQAPLAAFEAASRLLIEEEKCDIVIPITHQRLAEDRAFAANLAAAPGGGIALIVGGHDLKPAVDEAPCGCLIAKSGAHGRHAVIIDVSWPNPSVNGARPAVSAKLHALADHPRSARLDQVIAQHRRLLEASDGAFLLEIPPACRPLSSEGIQQQQTTAGTLLATLCREALRCDAAALDAGALLDAQRYPDTAEHLTCGDLRRLVPQDSAVCVVHLSGTILAAAVAHSRARAPRSSPGFMQLDNGTEWDAIAGKLSVVGGEELKPDKQYSVAVLFHSLNGSNRNQPLIDWANANGSQVPHSTAALPLKYALIRVACQRRPEVLPCHIGEDGANQASESLDRAQVKDKLRRMVGESAEVPDFMVCNLMSLVDPDNAGKLDCREFNNFVSFAEQLDAFKRAASECTLRIITVNDVYELGNLPFLDGVIRSHMRPNTITTLPGDFLAPSLLSSLDKGKGMIDLLNRVGDVGIQYVCFGNHETDVPIEDMRRRISEFKGVWLNTNMPDFQPALPDFKIIEVNAGGQRRRVGLIGLLTIDKNLYRPGAFGGGIDTAIPVVETAIRYWHMQADLLSE